MGGARPFKFGAQINTDEYYCTYHRSAPNGIFSGLCDLFKFWEIIDNVLETVQNRDTVTMED